MAKWLAYSTALFVVLNAVAWADDIGDQIAAIAAVGPQGGGSDKARAACRDLSARGPEVLPRLLVAMDTPNAVAANWFRAAFEHVVARELSDPRHRLPMQDFKSFIRQERHSGRARRLALVVVDRVEPAYRAALIPTLLDDPEFRDDAVAAALTQGSAAQGRDDKSGARQAFERAFAHALSPDQVTAAAGKLQSLGEKVSIAEHLGLVTDWSVIGPFPAPGMSGFQTVFPPESSAGASAEVALPDYKQLRWLPCHTSDPFGTVDLVQTLGPVDEAVGYAFTILDLPADRQVELRCSADDNLSVWLNGKKVFGRDMWLNGTRFDRFRTPVQLRAGKNRVLVKICQGPHHRDPAVGNAWTFQLRFCTSNGAGVPFKTLPAAAGGAGVKLSEQSTSGR